MRKLAVIWAVFSVCLTAMAQLSPEEALRQAAKYEKEGSFRRSRAIYDSFLKDHPQHIQTLNVKYRLAICHDNIGDTDKAVDMFKEVMAGGKNRHFKHRSETAIKLAKLLGASDKHQEAVELLTTQLKEGAGLYEDEAQNLCGGYQAILGNFDEAAVMFNILQNKRNSPLAKEAAYKLAIVWMKSGKTDMAKHAVEQFAARHPAHPKTVELFCRIARHYFEGKKYKSALGVCTQVKDRYKMRPEAMEAAFIIALCYREAGRMEDAIKAFKTAARMPQAAHNTVLATEAYFEVAQLLRKNLKREQDAMEYYSMAATKARNPVTKRQKKILEYCLFNLGEYNFRKENWSSALDLYMQLRKAGSELNVLSRILHCQSKMDQYGAAALFGDDDEEIKFIKARIAANPGTLVALQAEIFLLDKRLERETLSDRATGDWARLSAIISEFQGLLKKYPAGILKQQSLDSYIMMRMAHAHGAASEERLGATAAAQKWATGLGLYEKALAAAPDSLFLVEMLEGVAVLGQKTGKSRKAFDAYKRLYQITGKEAARKFDPNNPRTAAKKGEEPGHESFRYIRGLATIADTTDMVEEAINTVKDIIARNPPESVDAREARFYLGELYYMKRRYSDAAREYKTFIRQYGPPLDANGDVIKKKAPARGGRRKPAAPARPDEVLAKVYECGVRIAHCWYSQGHTKNMLKAYEWIIENQDGGNRYLGEAHYVTILNMTKGKDNNTSEKKKEQAEAFWRRAVNPSMDWGSEEFNRGFHFWIKDPVAVPYVKTAVLKSGELHSAQGRHTTAAHIFKQYLRIYSPEELVAGGGRRGSKQPRFPRDEMYDIASYAAGREFIQAGDFASMAEIYRPYIDGLRGVTYRPSVLMLLGHYGTEGEMYQDAREAYAALLDEYGAPNPVNKRTGLPVPVKKEARLRQKSSWNGIRMQPPAKWDPGKIRYSLGYLYWKKEDWRMCRATLNAFLTDASLKSNKSRQEALFMLGRSSYRLKDLRKGTEVLGSLLYQYPKFKGNEEAFIDVMSASVKFSDWKRLDRYYALFVQRHPQSLRRPYADFYDALGKVRRGQKREGLSKLRGVARADTYEDLKADAFYEVAVQVKSDKKTALKLLERSIEYYPRANSLLEAGRCAVDLQQWKDARTYLDRCIREFPRSEEKVLREARLLLAKVSEAQAGRRR
ncbi:tetratricopeptide repeat protein [Verrucomicrobiota bacterium]